MVEPRRPASVPKLYQDADVAGRTGADRHASVGAWLANAMELHRNVEYMPHAIAVLHETHMGIIIVIEIAV